MEAVLAYLDQVDPEAARRARARYACFDHAREDSQAYGYGASFGLTPSCEDEVVQQLREMNRRAADARRRPAAWSGTKPSSRSRTRAWCATPRSTTARCSAAAISSWNLRDSHMVETLQALDRHLGAARRRAAHRRLGAQLAPRATPAPRKWASGGEWNVGQLVRDRYGADAVLVGFSTYRGWVTAASDWDDPPERKRVRAGLAGS